AFAAAGAAFVSANRLVVVVDGKPVEFKGNAQPMVYRGRVMVPMRGIFEALGATLTYDPTTRTVQAQRNNEAVELTFGSKIAKKNGAEILLDTPPSIIKNVTYVPMRFIAESLGAKLSYDKPNMRLTIVTDPAPKGGSPDPSTTGPFVDPDPLPMR
ncbi:copper amine oxidase N-terminal domain-containing protein, partial [bacterium]